MMWMLAVAAMALVVTLGLGSTLSATLSSGRDRTRAPWNPYEPHA